MSLTELKEQAGHLSRADQRKLAAYLRIQAHSDTFALEAACRAANQDDALAREVEEWQA